MYTTVGAYYSFQMNVHFPEKIISTNCCIHTVVPLDDGPRYARNMQRLTKYTKNKLCIKVGFLYTTLNMKFPQDKRQQCAIIERQGILSVPFILAAERTQSVQLLAVVRNRIPVQCGFRAVQTSPEPHPGSCTMGTQSFLQAKLEKRSADYSPLAIAGLRIGWSCTSYLYMFLHKNVDTIRYDIYLL